MLTLQRASAGSGKTFTLARTFIRHLITEQRDGKTSLRSYEALPDAVSHILAVTFTNKATNEMKQRIIEKLYALSRMDLPVEDVNYLKDFMEEFGVGRQEIANRCALALKYLLLDYSNFNVSTIDSFFQNILRTFAYEAELPDGYKLEIDNDYVASVGVDTMIQDMMSSELDTDTLFWLNMLTRRSMAEDKDWNIVNKRRSKTNPTLYDHLCKAAQKIDNEDFKRYLPVIDRFITDGHKLAETYREIDNHYLPAINDAFDKLRTEAFRLLRIYSRNTPKGLTDIARDKAISNLRSITHKYADSTSDYNWSELTARKSPVNKIGAQYLDKDKIGEIREAYDRVSDAWQRWRMTFRQEGWNVWQPLRKLLPYVALIYKFKENIRNFLELNNTMVLADTNTILSRIIEDGEVPFIYERLSTRIHHFLIDEFQDTSLMQWDNFRPLLAESMSHGYDNLIIGDAKQSIYRFRNADPSIITEKVPAAFDNTQLNICGDKIEQNSNWRSDLHIVQFNNYLFRRFHEEFSYLLGDLYSGVVQQPRQTARRGYVEWMPYDTKMSRLNIGSENKYDVIGPMISGMLTRGYRQKDIAILCNKNDTAMEIIASLMEYNSRLGEGEQQLYFVSEQSLQLRSNRAVQVVISALKSLAEGVYYPESDSESDNRPENVSSQSAKEIDWRTISTRFILYSNSHTDLPLSERIQTFFTTAMQDDKLSEMVSQMQATTLPALVEAIIDMFLHNGVEGSGSLTDAPFLAALQDAVLNYSSLYVADITSFLDWWNTKGQFISISSPEDTDAINIMTIHKSKGLEFECVILPDIDLSLKPGNNGPWKWVRIPDNFGYSDRLPAFLPVEVSGALSADSSSDNHEASCRAPYEHLWSEECRMVLTDNLNKLYVALTRAVSELYILTDNYHSTSRDKRALIKDDMRVRNKLAKYLKGDLDNFEGFSSTLRDLYIKQENLTEPEEFGGIFYGEQPTEDNVSARIARRVSDEQKNNSAIRQMDGYFINSDQSTLKYAEEDRFRPKPGDDETDDPRSEGSLIHSVLEYTRTYDDLPGAITRLRLRGLINSAEADTLLSMLSAALEHTRHTHWFDGSLNVINERPILKPGYPRYRPDRLLVTPDRRIIVVDYKTGSSEKNSSHHRQVRSYMRLLMESGRYRSAEGWLWYIKENKIEKVEFAK